MAINRTDIKCAAHSSISCGSPRQWNQTPHQWNYSGWWRHPPSSNVSPGHLVNHKELGKTEPTWLEDKSAPTFRFLKCEGGDFSFVQGACEMVILSEERLTKHGCSYLPCLVPAPLRFVPTPLPEEVLWTLPGGGEAVLPFSLKIFLSSLFLKAFETFTQDSRFLTVWSISHPLPSPFIDRHENQCKGQVCLRAGSSPLRLRRWLSCWSSCFTSMGNWARFPRTHTKMLSVVSKLVIPVFLRQSQENAGAHQLALVSSRP